MGLLRSGDILSWNQLLKSKNKIKTRGINQFIDIYKRFKGIKASRMAFGDELEIMMIIKNNDHENNNDNDHDTNNINNINTNINTNININNYKLYCCSENVIGKTPFSFVEYARYMVETSTLIPFNENSIDKVEENILFRINEIYKSLPKNVDLLMIPCFFNLKFKNFYDINSLVDDVTFSLNFPFNGITRHKRFVSFTENIRNRRGRKIEGYVEIMKDKKTKEKNILIDSMGQGMGCCGLQITIQGKNIKDTKYLYDMMGIFAPLGLRLSRGTPIASGRLLKSETRWEMLEMSVDCRKDEERECGGKGRECKGRKMGGSKNNDKVPNDDNDKLNRNNDKLNLDNKSPLPPLFIPKSRFSPIDFFISDHQNFNLDYNDIYAPLNKRAYSKLRKEKIDKKISKHISSLFVRDPMVSYDENYRKGDSNGKDDSRKDEGDSNGDEDDIRKDEGDIRNMGEDKDDPTNKVDSTQTYLKNDQISFTHTDDFENIQSSNWRSVRFKIPTENAPPDLCGWKVELRSMDIQATVFENTSLIYLSFLLSEAILLFDLNLYIPISLVDENFKRANAFIKEPSDYKKINLKEDDQLFYYRRNIKDKGKPEIKEGTLKEIFLGDGGDEVKVGGSSEVGGSSKVGGISEVGGDIKSDDSSKGDGSIKDENNLSYNPLHSNPPPSTHYKGLFHFIYLLIDQKYKSTSLKIYIQFLENKLKNQFISLGDWIRKFVINHPDYKEDSVVSDKIINELIEKLIEIRKKNEIEYLRNEN